MFSPRLETPQRAPSEVAALWLRYHELQLCQEFDVTFVFKDRGLEAWCRVEDDRSYERFLQLVDPLKGGFEIDVYPTRLTEERKNADKVEPPPSLSNNPELMNYLFGTDGPARMPPAGPNRSFEALSRDMMVKQRILMFAEQTRDWNARMRRYACELPAFVAYGLAAGSSTGLTARTAALCLQHAQGMDRHALKLEDNLKQAMPPESRRAREDAAGSKAQAAQLAALPAAEQVAELAQAAGQQVNRFIYPQMHTVAVSDLKEPSVLHSLRKLRQVSAGFQQAVRRSAKL